MSADNSTNSRFRSATVKPAAVKPAARAADPSEGHAAVLDIVRVSLVVAATIALLIVWPLNLVRAQGSAGHPDSASTAHKVVRTSHVVVAGETLWGIASIYYGDGSSWQELARANGISTSSAKPLVIGMKLAVPAQPQAVGSVGKGVSGTPGPDVPKVALAAAAPRVTGSASPATGMNASSSRAKSPSTVSAKAMSKATAEETSRATSSASLADQTAGKGDAKTADVALRVVPAGKLRSASASAASGSPESAADERMANASALNRLVKQEFMISRGAVRVGFVDPANNRTARGNDQPTIFVTHIPVSGAQQPSRTSPRASNLPRRGELDAAPFEVETARLVESAMITRRVGSAGSSRSDSGQRMIMTDQVEISVGSSNAVQVGDQFISVRASGVPVEGVQVVVPGGVLEVIRADAGMPVIALVKSQSGLIEQGQRLLPRPAFAPISLSAESAGNAGNAASAADVHVTWVEQGALLPTLHSYLLLDSGVSGGVQAGDMFSLVRKQGSDTASQEMSIAMVRVVKAGANSSSAIVVKQQAGGIAPGIVARRSQSMR